MIFTYIEYLALLPLFFLVWAWARRGLWKRRPRQWLEQPALRQGESEERAQARPPSTWASLPFAWFERTVRKALASPRPTGTASRPSTIRAARRAGGS